MNVINLMSMLVMYLSIIAFWGVNHKYYFSNKYSLLLLNTYAWWEKAFYYASPTIAYLIIVQSFRYLFSDYDILSSNFLYISGFSLLLFESYQYTLTAFQSKKREVSASQEALNNQKTSRFDIVFSIFIGFGFVLGGISYFISLFVHQNQFFEQISLICFSIMRIGMWGDILKNRHR